MEFEIFEAEGLRCFQNTRSFLVREKRVRRREWTGSVRKNLKFRYRLSLTNCLHLVERLSEFSHRKQLQDDNFQVESKQQSFWLINISFPFFGINKFSVWNLVSPCSSCSKKFQVRIPFFEHNFSMIFGVFLFKSKPFDALNRSVA